MVMPLLAEPTLGSGAATTIGISVFSRRRKVVSYQRCLHQTNRLHHYRLPILCGNAKPNASKAGKPRDGKPKAAKSQEEQGGSRSKNVSLPMQVKVKEHLTGLDQTNQPLWSTFCGLTNGVWQGRMAAFYAATGEPEPVSMEGKTPVFDLHTLAVEERPEDEVILRRVLLTTKLSDIREASLPEAAASQAGSASRDNHSNGALRAVANQPVDSQSPTEPPSTSGEGASRFIAHEGWEAEQMVEGEDGLMFFDGGTFSRGPHWLVDPPDETADEMTEEQLDDKQSEGHLNGAMQEPVPGDNAADKEAALATAEDYGMDESPARKVSVVEQCLAWGGEQRLRLLLTLSVGIEDSELDVEVLRLVLWREAWQGLSEECLVDRCIAQDVKNPLESASLLSTAPRTNAEAFEGKWKAYDISAVPIEDADPLTGEVKRLALYYSQETRQEWRQGRQGEGNIGAAIWLPNNVLVELQMLPPSSRGTAADEEEGMQGSSGSGFLITFSWVVKETTVIGKLGWGQDVNDRWNNYWVITTTCSVFAVYAA